MRRFLVIAALLSACAPPAPTVDLAPMQAAESLDPVGPDALCADPTKLVSERGPDGPTVYYCAD
jgi:hypothetical protein